MRTVVNIRGTSGSGKSTLVRLLRDFAGGWEPILPAEAEARRAPSLRALAGVDSAPSPPAGVLPEGYRIPAERGLSRPVYVVGPYENVAGGCDKIRSQDEICDRVRRFAERGDGHVLFEGVVTSTIYERYADLARELQEAEGIEPVFLYLDTPLEVCLARIRQRRRAEARARGPLNPFRTTEKYRNSARTEEKFAEAGFRVLRADHEDPLPDLFDALGEEIK